MNVLKKMLSFGLDKSQYESIKPTLEIANSARTRLFSLTGACYFLVGALTPFIIEHDPSKAVGLLVCALLNALVFLSAVLQNRIREKKESSATVLMYIGLVVLLLCGIYTSVFENSSKSAVVYHLLLICATVIVILPPLSCVILPLVATTIFMLADFYVKGPTLALADMINVVLSTSLAILMGLATSKMDINNFLFQKNEKEQMKTTKEALEIAQSASQAKGEFLSRMSYEIRTPLNAMAGYMAIAKETEDRKKLVDYLNKSEIASKQLLAIVNDVLDISSMGNGQTVLNEEKFNLFQFIEGITNLYETQAKQKEIVFKTRNITEYSTTLRGDTIRLGQILMNLLAYAIKFTPNGGKVSLSVSQVKANDERFHARFEVSDSGIGMDENLKKKLFLPLEQQDSSIEKRFGETGLGIAITKNLVNLMGGTIEVQSSPNLGTSFVVDIPFIQEKEDKEEEYVIPDTYSFEGKRVLIAEDNIMNMEIEKVLFVSRGFEVECACNGLEALNMFNNSSDGHFDLIIMDVMMPEMNGYEATRSIRESQHPQAKSIPIIAMTASAFSEDVSMAFNSGMNDHVSKPINAKTVFQIVAKNLQKD